MGKQTPVLIKTFTADAAILGPNQIVVLSTTNAGNVKTTTTVGDTAKVVGVTAGPTDASLQVEVVISGIAQVISDGTAISAGDFIQTGNVAGSVRPRTITFDAVTATNNLPRQVLGVALQAAAATAGILVDVQLRQETVTGT